ncbi:MAG: hypothetical protein FD169_207 [Bacillota bacterium]|nr:MAG: hypothetical protein FD169_207 [Bacillota bacterium]
MSSLRLTNGKIFTGNPTAPWAEELLILNGRIAWVGDGEAPSLPGVETLDLGGRLALPGLVDAHVHFLWYALGLDSVRMVGVESLDQALALVAERIRNSGPGEWIVGDSYNHNVWGMEREPNRYDLDRVAPDHPVFISSKCGHTAWVNSKALALAGVTAVTPNPEGSRIDRDSQGEPTGLLRESAQGLVGSVIPDPDPAKACMMLKRAIGIAHSMGLTGIHNCEGRDSLRHFGKLAREGELNFRVVHHVPADSLDEAITLGLTSGVGGEWVRIGGVKLFIDGALGSQTALMFEPHEGSENLGIQTMAEDELKELVLKAAQGGISSAIHAIGDRANNMVLNMYETALKDGDPILRHRIEHVQLLTEHDVARLGSSNIIASVQPTHVLGDIDLVHKYWGQRGRYAYPFKSLLKTGAVLVFGSDCPVESMDPILGIHAAVNRQRPSGYPEEGFYPEERLTVAEAVRAYTFGPAYASYQEDTCGTLECGRLGDLVVLEQDIFTIPPQEIHTVKVRVTVVGGKVVYQS